MTPQNTGRATMYISLVIDPDPRRTLRGARHLMRPLLLRLLGFAMAAEAIVLLIGRDAVGWASLALAAATPGIVWAAIEWRVRQGIRPLRDVTMTVELREDGFQVWVPERSSSWHWAAVRRVTVYRDLWLVRLAPRGAVMLPQQAFTEAQRAEFTAFLDRRALR